MLHILLLILKIIGIVLLVILGVLLLGIACALFVPVRYRIEAVRQEGEGEPPVTVRVKVTWLLHLFNLLVRFDGELFVRARISIVTILRIPKKEKHRKKAETEKNDKKNSIQEKRQNTEKPIGGETDETDGQPLESAAEMPRTADGAQRKNDVSQKAGQIQESAITGEADTAKQAVTSREDREREPEVTQTLPEEEREGSADAEEEDDGTETQEKPGLWEKLCAIPEILQRLFEKIRRLFENIEYTINRFCDKIRSVSDTIEYYREVVEGEPFKRSFALCKDELTTIIKHLRPRKFKASLIVGMDDPASTGEILAVCGMLYPIIGGHVDVRGDFEKKRLEGQILIVGKLCMFTFLRAAVRIYFNKDIRKLYRLLKRRQ